MKRTIIGGFIMLGGLIMTSAIIISGAIYATSITGWTGKSKLWYVIFGEKQYGNEVAQSLFLGLPFAIGIILTVLGLIIVGYEYAKTFKE
ncbi:hypothetical protein [Lysinibacillus odysseyi]|uniref:Uncharacterized protein n=1 Tax=Lysinibacillus odysseyi 34hs-1 = NBRC 100172 TaxID=1220589 RepID=A0A0A3IM24_9BACI|nr:hypothetical protein [Lysinibacillus odysseyi]KGR84545.1 hypothetical protein CD32_13305 [Lysinibacillus odysseyi 34hs-1 = NBRC 100172]